MKTNLTRLKSTKGTPPSVDATPDVIRTNTRPINGEKTMPLQVKIPEPRLREFSELAAKTHGFKKGAKSDFFLEMLDFYRRNMDETC